MIAFRNLVLATAISASYALLSSHDAKAFDLTGAWATSSEQCTKVFVRKGRANNMTFTNFSGVYGRGFIVEADRLRGKFENCKIKSRNESNRTVNLVAACASGGAGFAVGSTGTTGAAAAAESGGGTGRELTGALLTVGFRTSPAQG